MPVKQANVKLKSGENHLLCCSLHWWMIITRINLKQTTANPPMATFVDVVNHVIVHSIEKQDPVGHLTLFNPQGFWTLRPFFKLNDAFVCAKWAIFIILGFHIWLINFLPSLSFFSFIGCTDVSLMKKTNTFLTDPAELVCSFPLTGATVINYVLYVVFVLQIITDGMCQKCDLRSCSNVWSGEGQMSTNNIQTKPHQFVASSYIC